MGSIIDRLNSFFSRKADNILEPKMVTSTGELLGSNFEMMQDDPKEYIEKGLVYNPDLSAVINYIEKVATRVPWSEMRDNQVVENSELERIFYKGNGINSAANLWGTFISRYLTVGNSFLLGVAPENGVNAGKFLEFWNLHYDMKIEKDRTGMPIFYINPLTNRKYPAENVIHWKTANPDGDGYFGTSPLKAGRLVLQQSNEAYLANAKSLQNLGVRGLLTREGLYDAGPEKAKELQRDLGKMMGGADKFGKIPIAGGSYDYINFAVSPVDLQILDAQLRARQAICNIYGFPSELVNDKESSTYNNMMMIMRRLYTDVIIPLLEDMADTMHDKWVSKFDPNAEFRPDYSGIEALQDNKKEQSDWLSQAWWISAERKAEIMGEEASVFGNYIPANLIPYDMEEINIDEAIKQYKLESNREK